jgi:hypothetical protein
VIFWLAGLPRPGAGRTKRGSHADHISQASWVSNSVKTLSKATLWSSIGVTCNVGTNTVLCFNRDNRGFVIGNGKYKSF